MKPPGTYKIRSRRRGVAGNGHDGAAPLLPKGVAIAAGSAADGFLEQLARSEHRVRRIIDSLRNEILAGGGGSNLRIRQIFRTPREIYRLELELPALGYQRTTLLDRDALEELLEADEVRACVESASLGG